MQSRGERFSPARCSAGATPAPSPSSHGIGPLIRPACVSRYLLHPDVYACEIDAGAIFLDLRRLKYFAVQSPHLPCLRRNVGDWPQSITELPSDSGTEPDSSEVLRDFLEQGVLTVAQQASSSGRTGLIPAKRTIMSVRRCDTQGVLSFGGFLSVARAALYVYTQLCRRKLNHLVKSHIAAKLSAAARSARPPEIDRVRELTATFQCTRPWLYSSAGACLYDSLTLVEFLRYNGVFATLAIGVLTNPFEAHAWVQMHDVVLNDTVEHVREYTPILAA